MGGRRPTVKTSLSLPKEVLDWARLQAAKDSVAAGGKRRTIGDIIEEGIRRVMKAREQGESFGDV